MSDRKRTRTEEELEKLGEGMSGTTPAPAPKAPAPKPPPAENKGTGRDLAAESRAALIRQLDARITAARAANNMDLVNKYMAQKKQLESM